MGNKASGPVPSFDALTKRFSAQEMQAVEDAFRHRPGSLREGDFLKEFGQGMGLAGERLLKRLFRILDANNSGLLEFEEYASAAFFFGKANRQERLRVLYAMYCTGTHLSKGEVAAMCAEAYLAAAERQPSSESSASRATTAQAPPPPPADLPFTPRPPPYRALLSTAEPSASPFRDLALVVAEIAMAHYDADRDNRLSFAEFANFSQQADSGVDDALDVLTQNGKRALAPYPSAPT